jgi:hypothetical protein
LSLSSTDDSVAAVPKNPRPPPLPVVASLLKTKLPLIVNDEP